VPRLLLLDLDDTLVDRDDVLRQWAREMAEGHEDVSLQSWLVDFDRHDGRVRDRGDYLTGVAHRLGWSDSVDVLLERWPQMFGARYRLGVELQAALRRGKAPPANVTTVRPRVATRRTARQAGARAAA
jgi:FMN phosphatase YigB (HAD superfamily)